MSEMERNQSLLSGIKDMFSSISFKGGVASGMGSGVDSVSQNMSAILAKKD